MKHSALDYKALKKVAALFRDHSVGQAVNALRFEYLAWRGFRSPHLPYAPVRLTLFVTARCNLRCLQCPFRSPDSPRDSLMFQDMTLDSFEQILDRFPKAIGVHLTGGEPLLNPRLFEMIHLAHTRRTKVRISTNGTQLSRHIDALLASPVELLNVSLYGADAESFAQLTGASTVLFDDILAAVAELAGRRSLGGYPRILRASFICTKQTMDRAVEFVRLCETLGVDQVILHNLFHFGIPGYEESMCLHKDDPEVQRFVSDLKQERFRIPVLLPKLYKREYKPPTSTMPFGLLSIDGDGFIGPCCIKGTGRQWDNLFEADRVWNGPTMTEARRELLDPEFSLPPVCMHCEEMIPDRVCVKARA